MTPAMLLTMVVRPTLAQLGSPWFSHEAQQMLVAIAVQESGLLHRRQLDGGPARSFWQIEPRTAVRVATRWPEAIRFMREAGFNLSPQDWAGDRQRVLEHSDSLACCIARGILALDPEPLPSLIDPHAQWACYERCWRPGKPRPSDWLASFKAAARVVTGARP